ncbi:ABC transporter ATP-binding protein [Garciella nitratireducens]|uniref:ABC transporter ATP-binding protein n=1 Tax=Garciella nitratireducens TaxID=218205 RepID=UPI000E07BD3B|nr:ABC transporter ATP-binding protein [Garciella nitratireducens]RBP38235.1 ABC-2 type transport system ATP-binding protein [Garciella nitratireducens]
MNDLNLIINTGEIYGLLGHNGAGKTTALRLMLGLMRPNSGEISVFGLNPIEKGRQIRAKCGVLSEYVGLYEPLTVYENLKYYAEIYGVSKNEYDKRMDELLELFEISHKKHSSIKGFSTGMKKKVALIRAILHNPPIVLLDEPTNGLDPVSIEKLRKTILDMSKKYGTTFIITTHNLDEVVRTCDKISILKHGKDIVTKTIRELEMESQLNITIQSTQNLENLSNEIEQTMKSIKSIINYELSKNEILITMEKNVTSEVIKKLSIKNINIENVITKSTGLLDLYMKVESDSHE